MSLRAIVRALGGDLYDGGRRANVPAPNHSMADRSVSLLLQDDRVVVHSFGGADWRDVLDDLRERRLIDDGGVLLDSGRGGRAAQATPSRLERRNAALRIWEDGRAVAGTLSERHCHGRAITRALPGPEALRHNGDTAVSIYRPGLHRRPALLAGIQDAEGTYTGVEITYLTPGGRRADDLRLPRKTVGLAPGGCAVRLDPADTAMLVAEGVFTTLSAGQRFSLPGWALLSTRNLRAWRAPPGVRSVLIAGDRGKDGEASAERLRVRLEDDGVAAFIEFPPEPFGDWNDWAQGR
jgi:putative DNA primase/helicase